MSDAPLPADVERWPENPFELLGVEPSVDAKDLKRAYQRLIRAYRPEEFPTQFRRVREAYEAAKTFLELTGGVVEVSERRNAASGEGRPADPLETSPADGAAAADAPLAAPVDEFERRLADAWALLRSRKAAEALPRLDELTAERPTRYEPYLGRYWLLRMMPRVAPNRQACDELLACLAQTEARRGPALELYRRELERRPDETLTPRCERLLRSGRDAPPTLVIAERRWRHAAAGGAWSLIRDDLAALRQSPLAKESEVWVFVVWHAVDATAWSNDEAAATLHAETAAELDRVTDARTAMHGNLAQAEFMLETARGVRTLRKFGFWEPYCRIVADSWSAPTLDLFVACCSLVAPYAGDPHNLLMMLNEAGQRSAPALDRFHQVVVRLVQEMGEAPPPIWTVEAARRAVGRFMNAAPWKQYVGFRTSVLKFCLQNLLTPYNVAELLHAEGKYVLHDGTSLAQQIANDRPLQVAYELLRLFQG